METVEEIIKSKILNKYVENKTWSEVANDIYEATNERLTPDACRQRYKKYTQEDSLTASIDEKILELKKEKVKLSDERVQNNAYVRQLAREETIKEIAKEAAYQVGQQKPFLQSENTFEPGHPKSAILQISDWHYGIDIENAWNKYNPDIAKSRVNKLKDTVIARCKENKVNYLCIADLGDLIAGRIHLGLRLESRFDVITQTIEVSELVAEMINAFVQEGIYVDYYSCLDNHSRLEPNKSDAMDLESLQRIIPWYLKERFKDEENVNVNNNYFGEDIITFNILGYDILGVHGDKDSQISMIDKLSMMTKHHFDMMLSAHMHHFSADEKNETLVISNSSLMGTDTFAKKLRLSSLPSQNLIIVSRDNVCDTLYRILVE